MKGNQCLIIKSHMREDNDPLGHHLGNEDLLLAVESYAEDFCLATILMLLDLRDCIPSILLSETLEIKFLPRSQ